MVIAIANQKGGVGKSTTAIALAAGLAANKRKTLIIDLDAQGNTTAALRADPDNLTVFDVLSGNAPAAAAVQDMGALCVIPAARQLALADVTFVEMGKEYMLKNALSPIAKNYEFILVDTPPALGVLTANALTAAAGVIIPACSEPFGLQGIAQLGGTLNAVRKYSNKHLQILGVLLTRYRQTRLMNDMEPFAERIAKDLGTSLYKTRIREATALKEAQAKGLSIFDHAPSSNGAQDYASFVREFLSQIKRGAHGAAATKKR